MEFQLGWNRSDGLLIVRYSENWSYGLLSLLVIILANPGHSQNSSDADQIISLIHKLYPTDVSIQKKGASQSEVWPCLLCLPTQTLSKILVTPFVNALGISAPARERTGSCIGYGPLVNGQDYNISNFTIGTPKITGNRAAIGVKFQNFGANTEIKFDIQKVKNVWKISNINNLRRELDFCSRT